MQTEQVEVTQVDREAAIAFWDAHMAGWHEQSDQQVALVQAFARHRLAHQPQGSEGVEAMREALLIAKGWFDLVLPESSEEGTDYLNEGGWTEAGTVADVVAAALATTPAPVEAPDLTDAQWQAAQGAAPKSGPLTPISAPVEADHIASAGKMVPAGYALVPITPTEAMLEAWENAEPSPGWHIMSRLTDAEANAGLCRAEWSAMIATAPTPDTGGWEPHVFLDCDGVLADFDTYAEAYFGMPPRQYEKQMGSTRFWQELEAKGDFYRNLPLMPDAMRLFEAVKHLHPTILTGCPRGDWAQGQKVAWAAEHFPGVPIITCRSADKRDYAKRGDVLIDDWPQHRHRWIEMGGVFIVHHDAASSLAALWAHYPALGPLPAPPVIADGEEGA